MNVCKHAMTFVYAKNQASDRAILWKQLCSFASSFRGPWVLMGDFHCVRRSEEKIEARSVEGISYPASSFR